MKVGRMPDLITDVEGGPSKVVVDRDAEANGAEHDSGEEADGTHFKIGQSKHEIPSASEVGHCQRVLRCAAAAVIDSRASVALI